MNFWEKAMTTDRRVIYILLAVCIAIPLVKPLGLPVSIGQSTRAYHTVIDALKPGDTVIMSLEVGVSTAPDVFPQAQAVFQHLMDKGVRVIIVTFAQQGALYTNDLCLAGEAGGKKYGTDFVAMGFVPGGETGLAGFAADIKKTVPVDLRKNKTEDLPILKGITSAADTKAYLGFSDGVPGPFEYVRQLQRSGVPLLVGVVTVMGPQTEPYIQSGQVKGLLTGLRGAAEYEMLMNKPGAAVAGMDAQSAGHLLIIVFILLGNIGFAITRRKQPKGGAK